VAAKKVDRRVQRTRQLLLDALLMLIRERGFESLSVQDIIDRANVGRATFYAHFENKEDLLLSGLEDFRTAITEHQRRRLQETEASADRAFLFIHELLAHVAAHRDVFRAMVGRRSGAVVQRLVQKILLDLVREDLKPMLTRTGDRSVTGEAAVQYIAAGLWGLLAWWVDAKRNASVEEMEVVFRQLAVPSVKAMLL
jgi:AcrR family transcriptional regulator